MPLVNMVGLSHDRGNHGELHFHNLRGLSTKPQCQCIDEMDPKHRGAPCVAEYFAPIGDNNDVLEMLPDLRVRSRPRLVNAYLFVSNSPCLGTSVKEPMLNKQHLAYAEVIAVGKQADRWQIYCQCTGIHGASLPSP